MLTHKNTNKYKSFNSPISPKILKNVMKDCRAIKFMIDISLMEINFLIKLIQNRPQTDNY